MKAFPNLKRWMDTTDDSVKKLGYVTSLVGRKRRMPEAITILRETGPWIFDSLEIWKMFNESPSLYEEMKEKRRKITNYINNGRNFQIQSLAASVVNRSSIAINRELKKQNINALIICSVHDQTVIECRNEDSKRVAGWS
jgi:DNA polymerase I-like protein with 3'-5' exonuclease and polymerase domains